MNTELMFSSQTDKWNTPLDLYNFLNAEFNFELDPCPAEGINNGLLIPWNKTTYINPPYGRGIGKWVEKGYESSLNGFTMVMLLPARTDTQWWHDYCMKASEIRFIRGRLHFNEYSTGAPFPSAIVIFRGGERVCLPRFYSIDRVGQKI